MTDRPVINPDTDRIVVGVAKWWRTTDYNTLAISKLLGVKEYEVYNRLDLAKRLKP
jgi:hypothetical protein